MNIKYVANIRFPTEKAHGRQIAKMIEAWSESDNNVVLIVPARLQHSHFNQTPKQAYGLKRPLKIQKLWCLDLLRYSTHNYHPVLESIAFWLQSITFSISLFFYSLSLPADTIYYSRNSYITLPLLLTNRRYFLELHHPPQSSFGILLHRFIMIRSRGVIFISNTLKQIFIRHDIHHGPNIVAHDCVDLEMFKTLPPKKVARARLHISKKQNIILYTGAFFPEKGINLLLEAAKSFSSDTHTYILGGSPIESSTYQFLKLASKLSQITAQTHLPFSQLSNYLSAADVLVLPVLGSVFRNHYGSPLKLFEYMASRRPIVASRLPAITEVVNSKSAILIRPDSVKALTLGINQALSDKTASRRLVKNAYQIAKQYTWKHRASAIATFILNHV